MKCAQFGTSSVVQSRLSSSFPKSPLLDGGGGHAKELPRSHCKMVEKAMRGISRRRTEAGSSRDAQTPPIFQSIEFREEFKSIFSPPQFQKSYKREHIIIKWILRITHMNKDGEVDFSDWVQDGKVLSK